MSVLAGAMLVALALYFRGTWRLRSRGRAWPLWRPTIFALGALSVVAVLSPPIASWAHHDFRGHMLVHLIVAMLAPIGLVFAAPVTLTLKNVPATWGRAWVALLGHPWVRLLCHPITAATLDVGGLYLLYLTGLYGYMLETPAFAVWLHWHFLLAGCLFTWAIAGPDPAPRRPSLPMRCATLIAAMVAHGVLAKWMYRFHFPREESLAAVQQGAEWMFYLGEVPEAILVYVLLSEWLRRRYPATPSRPESDPALH